MIATKIYGACRASVGFIGRSTIDSNAGPLQEAAQGRSFEASDLEMEPAPRGWTINLQWEKSACAGSLDHLIFSHLI